MLKERGLSMGKDLRGKELGVGISQRKDGLYTARFVDRNGKRRQKYFKKLQECRKWIADAQFEDEHGSINASSDMSVNAWFDYWIEKIKGGNIRPNTIRNYRDRFEKNIKSQIGDMVLSEVKPLHCQNVLNGMSGDYKNSTINLTRITLYGIFDSAVENGLIEKNPVIKSVKCAQGMKSDPKKALTIDEQRAFLETAKRYSNYNQYAFILQTGLRVGELSGLKWSDIDFKNKTMHIQRTIEYVYPDHSWRTGEPKSELGNRVIPLTNEAVRILKSQGQKVKTFKAVNIEFADHVFICRTGEPQKNSSYNKDLLKICSKAGINRISMHVLRHSFATRCIESGMKPKTLQTIMGHSDIGTTMDIYVHVTDEEKKKELENIEDALSVI